MCFLVFVTPFGFTEEMISDSEGVVGNCGIDLKIPGDTRCVTLKISCQDPTPPQKRANWEKLLYTSKKKWYLEHAQD